MIGPHPHRAAGQIAAVVFAVAGFLVGASLAIFVWHTLFIAVSALIWGALGAITGYLAFAMEGRQVRPASIVQAAIADGILAGITGAVLAAIVSTLLAGGAGTGTGPSSQAVIAAVIAGFAGGALGGAVLGWIVFLIGGQERLARPSPRVRPNRRNRRRHR